MTRPLQVLAALCTLGLALTGCSKNDCLVTTTGAASGSTAARACTRAGHGV